MIRSPVIPGLTRYLFLFYLFFWLEPKEPKIQVPANAPPPGRPTHLLQVWRWFFI